MTTLTDVAKAAGVSLATASRAYSEPDRLAAATRERVLEHARRLGYSPPAPSGPRTLGVVVPDIANAVFGSLVQGMQDRMWQGRHRMQLVSSSEDPRREREAVRTLAETVDGLVLCSPRLPAADLLDAVGATPTVLVNAEAEGLPSVLMEMGEGVRQAVEHLYALGHRRLAYVPGPVGSWADQRRQAAITTEAARWDLDLQVLGHQAAGVEGGRAAAASVVACGTGAVIAYNDLVAIGIQAGLRDLGRRCPEDLSVIGVDDLAVAASAQPGLTSIRVALDRSADLAVDLLLERLSGRPPATSAIHLQSQLIVRGSTAAASDLSTRSPA